MVQELALRRAWTYASTHPTQMNPLDGCPDHGLPKSPCAVTLANVAGIRPRRSLRRIPDWNRWVAFGMVPHQRTASCGRRAEQRQDGMAGDAERVLVVDDDLAVRNSLRFALEMEGLTVRT